ncbi:SpaH/EbpB family LPXTG-anchored major pilin [Floccifex sp.]|uniref:SpaH/EbpB family LPXTG-anchored major pilin n=1 Tax=Floccifex sp. TaxID=2815810 RepID=UPI003EFE7F6F
MKLLKKLTSLLATFIVSLFMVATPVMAAGDNSITVNEAKKGETYNIYKMLDLKVNADKTAYSYTINVNWIEFFGEEGAGATYVTIDNQGYVTWNEDKKSAANMENFGKAAAHFARANKVSGAVDAIKPTSDGSITFSNLESGYYLITSSNGTLAMVLTTPKNPSAKVNEKNPTPSLDKSVQEDSTSKWGKENSAQIGDTVNFKVTIGVQKGAKNYVMHDVMEDGLTFNANSVAIKELTKGTDYTVTTSGLTDGCTFEIRFDQSYLDKITEAHDLEVTYSAVLNEKADITNGEKNEAILTWGDNGSTKWSETVTKTYQFKVLKYDAKDNEKKPLAGATFQLNDAAGNVLKLIKVSDTEYRLANGEETGAVDSFTTVGAGKIIIKGVDLDQYRLVETKAPAGYNTLKDATVVNVTAGDTVTVEIANQSGVELPSTGGMGTTLFYVAGGILVIGAIVLLVTRKRMN